MEQAAPVKGSFVKRAIAFAIDELAIVVFTWLAVFLLSFLTAPFAGSTSQFGQTMWNLTTFLITAVAVLAHFLYFGYFWSRPTGQSVGMKLAAINVRREDGSRVGFFRSGLRGTVGYTISALVFGLGFIWALFDKHGEAWHDKIFDTRVFEYHYDPYGNYAYPAPRPPVDAGPDLR